MPVQAQPSGHHNLVLPACMYSGPHVHCYSSHLTKSVTGRSTFTQHNPTENSKNAKQKSPMLLVGGLVAVAAVASC